MHRVNAQAHGSKSDYGVAGHFRRQINSDIIQAPPSSTFDSATSAVLVTQGAATTTPRVVVTSTPLLLSSTTIFDSCTTCGSTNSSTSSSLFITPSSSSSVFTSSSTSTSTSATQTQASTSLTTPAITEGPQFSSSSSQKGSTLGIALGVSLGCLLLLSTTLCFILIRRKRRGRRAKKEEIRVEKPFGEETGFHLVVETGPSPTSITPFSALPSRPAPSPVSPLSVHPPSPLTSGKLAKSSPVDPPSGSMYTGSDSGTTHSDFNGSVAGTATMTNQQNLLDQLTALRAQIQQVEALARTQGLNPSSSTTPATPMEVGSEPPPEYDASMMAAGQGLVRDGKTSTS